MAYNTSLFLDKIDVIEPEVQGARTLWYWRFRGLICGVTWQKGARRLLEGDTTLYDTIMVRMRYTEAINDHCRFIWKGRYYEIESLYADYKENTVQITAHEVSKFKVDERAEPTPPNNNDNEQTEE